MSDKNVIPAPIGFDVAIKVDGVEKRYPLLAFWVIEDAGGTPILLPSYAAEDRVGQVSFRDKNWRIIRSE